MDYSSKTCDELIEILRYIPKEYYVLLPDELVNYLHRNCNSESTFVYNRAKPLKEQGISDETKIALRDIGKRYWGGNLFLPDNLDL
ncbi:hypothetical protein IJG04_00910 [Candidatus Saccharibacteria bacterium]|nr:hypothetical protein [Candidatus Saccharibacteria bacterium]